MSLHHFGAAAVLVALLGGCVSREEPVGVSEPAPVRTRVVRSAPPPDGGTLDLGLPPAREGGPAYVRSGISSSPRQGELYGAGTLPQGF
ncbi:MULTISPECIES: hypothetical protein [unclassified Bosea (in: a-proteobacteria)]|uniref:hypothetical protein n=1 Tax=unclassified Bosea (in: a-proteobacteria) TaxID=2653178 RepID=UPI000F7644B0|nr:MULTISPECIES: hypothetical protein [unclassified Bosea (in: a-proteobacteria)]AZO79698.1 hypothetical protein BLM15_20410 [Bosea sp. Tri-49]RXT16049.1 hypothetical protein B5U98_28980 [Bosea sp. Tri-39]RXT39742.1 hypothetical protein B5U99_06025 [Bosea sp. Tri-54]